MTKRFTFGAVSPNVAMIKDNGQGLDIGEIVDLLNSLSEENKQLRQTVHNLKQEPTNKDWDLLVQKCAELSKRNVELIEENERLKNRLNDEYIKEHSID